MPPPYDAIVIGGGHNGLVCAAYLARACKRVLVLERDEILDGSIEAEKETTPFLHGVPAILKALQSRQIECRVYDRDVILREPGEIVAGIRSRPDTPLRRVTEEKTLLEIRAKVEKHIKNTYLKRVDAPVGVKPALGCWMELND